MAEPPARCEDVADPKRWTRHPVQLQGSEARRLQIYREFDEGLERQLFSSPLEPE